MFFAAMGMASFENKSNDDEDGTIGSLFEEKQCAVVRSLRFLRPFTVAIEIFRRGRTLTSEKCSISLMVVLPNREQDENSPSDFFLTERMCVPSLL